MSYSEAWTLLSEEAYLDASQQFVALEHARESAPPIHTSEAFRQIINREAIVCSLGMVAALRGDVEVAKDWQHNPVIESSFQSQITIAMARAKAGDVRSLDEVQTILDEEITHNINQPEMFESRFALDYVVREGARSNIPANHWIHAYESDPSKRANLFLHYASEVEDQELKQTAIDNLFMTIESSDIALTDAAHLLTALVRNDAIDEATKRRAINRFILLREDQVQIKPDEHDTATVALAKTYITLPDHLQDDRTKNWLTQRLIEEQHFNTALSNINKIDIELTLGIMRGESAEFLLELARSMHAAIVDKSRATANDDPFGIDDIDRYFPLDAYFEEIAQGLAARGDFAGARKALIEIVSEDTAHFEDSVAYLMARKRIEEHDYSTGDPVAPTQPDEIESISDKDLLSEAYTNSYHAYVNVVGHTKTLEDAAQLELPELTQIQPMFGFSLDVQRFVISRDAAYIDSAARHLQSACYPEAAIYSLALGATMHELSEIDHAAAEKLIDAFESNIENAGDDALRDAFSMRRKAALSGSFENLSIMYDYANRVTDHLSRCQKLAQVALIGYTAKSDLSK